MKKPPKTEASRVKERKKEDFYNSKQSGNMAQIREDYRGKSFLNDQKETVRNGNSRIDADVTRKDKSSAVPNGQWEMMVNITPSGIPNDPAGAFLPMPGRIRPVSHKKVNECDY